jgi:DNA-binding transcriptional MerR regulator
VGMLPAAAPDGVIWLTTKQAAAELHVAPCTITQWRHKGYLTPHPLSPPRHPLYRLDDLLRAEATARLAAWRTSGTLKRVRRDRAA